jgi:hypothetical protein
MQIAGDQVKAPLHARYPCFGVTRQYTPYR